MFQGFNMSETLKKLDASIKNKQQQLEQLKAKKQAIEAREKSRLKTLERKEDTRRKILAGTFFLEATGRNVLKTVVNGKTLDEFLIRPNDSILFKNY